MGKNLRIYGGYYLENGGFCFYYPTNPGVYKTFLGFGVSFHIYVYKFIENIMCQEFFELQQGRPSAKIATRLLCSIA